MSKKIDTFKKLISANQLMKRWGLPFEELRMKNLPAYKQVDFVHWPYGAFGPNWIRAVTKIDPVTGQRWLKDIETEFTGMDIGEFIPKTKEDFKEAFYKIEDIEEFENKNPEILNEPLTIPTPEDTTWNQTPLNDIDYSTKSKSEQKELAKRWFKEGKSRGEIAKLLFKKEFENGLRSIGALMKRVDRKRGLK